MEGINNKRPASVKILIFLHVFLAVGAILGGLSFIMAPTGSGSYLELPISYLDNSPFRSFLIPGILLFTVLGVFPLLIAYYLFSKRPSKFGDSLNVFKDRHWSWGFSLYIGFALIIWITVQVYFLQVVGGLHLFYMAYSLLLLIVTLWPNVQRYYLDSEK
ncbi:hypothetical protein DHX103_11250 [Planococcus sp. X10-3]|uniref:hypothetical protein n=1 Tax=Planococcus sp. X10-3 TaxID=3061240 RepID=UPI003BAF32FE